MNAAEKNSLKPAMTGIAQRFVNSEEQMIDNIAALGEISRDDAVKVFNLYQRHNFFKREGIGFLHVKYGMLLERDVIRNALADA